MAGEGVTASSDHLLCDRGLADLNAELQELAVDVGRTHRGLALFICRIRSRTSRSTDGRPDLERQRQ